MTQTKRKVLYWLLKILGIIVACGLPIWAICEKFPIWTEVHGAKRSASVGLILCLIVILIVFRRTVFDFLRDKLDLKHAPPIFVWLVLLVCSYILVYIGSFMQDMTTVLWMGLIGCAIGTVFTFFSEKCR
jgi:ABC-type xylose transport system permease subunit